MTFFVDVGFLNGSMWILNCQTFSKYVINDIVLPVRNLLLACTQYVIHPLLRSTWHCHYRFAVSTHMWQSDRPGRKKSHNCNRNVRRTKPIVPLRHLISTWLLCCNDSWLDSFDYIPYSDLAQRQTRACPNRLVFNACTFVSNWCMRCTRVTFYIEQV